MKGKVFLLIFLLVPALGAEYYVSNDGNDNNPGTFEEPWETIGKANGEVQPGDTVYFMAGEYDGVIEPFVSGTEGNKITYRNYPGDEVFLRGEPNQFAVISLGWRVHGPDWDARNYIVIDGFNIEHAYTDTQMDYRPRGIFVYGSSSHHREIRNCKIQCHGTPVWEGYVDSGISVSEADYNIIENNYIDGWCRIGIGVGKQSFYNTFRNNTVLNCYANNLNFGSSLGTMQGNLVEGNTLCGNLISDCIQFEQDYDVPPPDTGSNQGVVIRNNILCGAGENAIDLKGASYIVIEGNIIYNNTGNNDGGLNPDQGDNRQGGLGGIMHGSGAGSSEVIIRNNVFYDCQGGILPENGFKLYGNALLYNNRDYTGTNSDYTWTRKPAFTGITAWNGLERIGLKNNIIGGHNSAEIALRNTATSVDMNNNLYLTNPKLVEYRGLYDWDVLGFDDWKQYLQGLPGVTGKDSQSIEADPLFVNVPEDIVGDHTLFDFNLQENSPGIDAGTHLTETTSSGSGSQVQVEDAGYFFDGYGITQGDEIKIGDNVLVRITDIDYDTNTLTIDQNINWNNGDPVSLDYNGNAPDIGAFESDFEIPDGEYYVSPDGNDNHPGTLSQPWQTIGKANQELEAGDIVYLREGVYSESIVPVNSGTPGNYITYSAFPGETVNITGVSRCADLSNKDYINLTNLNIHNCNSRWVLLDSSNHNIIRNCNMKENNGWAGILVKNAHYNKILGNTIEGADDSLYVVENSTHNLIEGNDFGDAEHGCIDIVGPPGSVEFGASPSYNIVRNNSLHSRTHSSFQLERNAHHNLIENNRIYLTTDLDINPGNGLQVDASANIIRKNLIYDNKYNGLTVNAYWYEGTFKHCNYNKIYHNVIYGNGLAQETNTGESLEGNIFKNNVFANNNETIYFWSGGTENEYNPFFNNLILQENPGDDVITWKNIPHNLSYMETNYPSLFANNIETEPMFTDPAGKDFTLQDDSPLIDAGAFLTETIGTGTGTQITLNDASYFCDGFGLIQGDEIQVGQDIVRITSIDYGSDEVMVNESISWEDGEPVSLVYHGDAPDIGAFEFEPQTTECGNGVCEQGESDSCPQDCEDDDGDDGDNDGSDDGDDGSNGGDGDDDGGVGGPGGGGSGVVESPYNLTHELSFTKDEIMKVMKENTHANKALQALGGKGVLNSTYLVYSDCVMDVGIDHPSRGGTQLDLGLKCNHSHEFERMVLVVDVPKQLAPHSDALTVSSSQPGAEIGILESDPAFAFYYYNGTLEQMDFSFFTSDYVNMDFVMAEWTQPWFFVALPPDAECGNGLLEEGEECDGAAGLSEGFKCSGCTLVALEPELECVDDGFCDGYEQELGCIDCIEPEPEPECVDDGFCSKEEQALNCTDCKEEETFNWLLLISGLMVLVALIVILVLGYIIHKKKSVPPPPIQQ